MKLPATSLATSLSSVICCRSSDASLLILYSEASKVLAFEYLAENVHIATLLRNLPRFFPIVFPAAHVASALPTLWTYHEPSCLVEYISQTIHLERSFF